MVLKINGIDLFALNRKLKIAVDGLEYALDDLDGEESGRATESGLMHRIKIAENHTITLTFTQKAKPEDIADLMRESRKKYVTVEFTDPFDYPNVTKTEFYNTHRAVKVKRVENGVIKHYDSVTLKLIGRGIPVGGSDNW